MNIQLKKTNIKKAVKNVDQYFESKGYKIPHHMFFEAISQFLGYRDWNTFSSLLEKENNNEKINLRVISIETKDKQKVLEDIVKHSFLEAGAMYNPVSIVEQEAKNKNYLFKIILDLSKTDKNFLMAITLLLKKLKSNNIPVKQIFYERKIFETENLTHLFE